MIISQERNGLDIAVQPLVDLLEEDREAEEELLSDFDLEQEALVSLSWVNKFKYQFGKAAGKTKWKVGKNEKLKNMWKNQMKSWKLMKNWKNKEKHVEKPNEKLEKRKTGKQGKTCGKTELKAGKNEKLENKEKHVEKPNEKLEKTKNWKTRKNMWKNQMKSWKKRKTGKQGRTCGKTKWKVGKNEKLENKEKHVEKQMKNWK